jgi:pimeloyl-ACP methyl ester carboxylesterase
MYHEIHGSGKGLPLVLLHGGLSSIEVDFGRMLPALAASRRVVAVEFQGHAHTTDIDRPLTYANLADDVLELLRQLDVAQADFFGYSVGAAVAIELAMRQSSAVRRMALATPAFNRRGFHPGLLEGIDNLTPELMAGSPFEQSYSRSAPRPEDWPALIEKQKKLDREWQGWSDEAVGSITAPALVVIGDSDIVKPEHAVELFRLLGGGVAGDVTDMPASRLAILPGTTHITLVHRAEWLVSMILEFLDAPLPSATAMTAASH